MSRTYGEICRNLITWSNEIDSNMNPPMGHWVYKFWYVHVMVMQCHYESGSERIQEELLQSMAE